MEAEKARDSRIFEEVDRNRVVVRYRARPKGDRVLIRDLMTPDEQNGVKFANQYLTSEGEVIAVGPGVKRADGTRVPLETAVGDRVKYSPYTGSTFKLNGEDVRI